MDCARKGRCAAPFSSLSVAARCIMVVTYRQKGARSMQSEQRVAGEAHRPRSMVGAECSAAQTAGLCRDEGFLPVDLDVARLVEMREAIDAGREGPVFGHGVADPRFWVGRVRGQFGRRRYRGS